MKIVVELFRLNPRDASNEKIGDIVYEKNRVTATNMGDSTMRLVMREPLVVDGKTIHRRAQPLEFMRNLCRHYRSPYLRATKAVID